MEVNVANEIPNAEALDTNVPIWGVSVLGMGCFLIGAASRRHPSANTLTKISRAANNIAYVAVMVKDLTTGFCCFANQLGRSPNMGTVNKIKRETSAVAGLSLFVKDWADASSSVAESLGRTRRE